MRKLVSEGSLQTDIGNLYGPKDPLKQKNDDLIQAFQSSRDRTARMRRHGSSSGGAGGSDVFSAIPRFYDPMEYWDLSGLPWNMADEGHRHKLHKWLRLYYATHSLIATLVDIFTRFPLAGMYLHSKDSQLTGFYEELFMNNLDYGQFLVDFGREYWCALPGEMVQTSSGVRSIESIAAGDEVLTHRGRVRPVIGASSRHYSGGYVEIRPHYGTAMRYTYGHPFMVRREGEATWIKSEDITTEDHLFVPVDQRIEDRDSINVWETLEGWLAVPAEDDVQVPAFVGSLAGGQRDSYGRRAVSKLYAAGAVEGDVWRRDAKGSQHSPLVSEIPLTNDMLWFLGLYLAEGSVTKDGVQIALHQDEVLIRARVLDIAESMGCTHRVASSDKSKGIYITIYSISFGAFMESFIGTGHMHKRIPEWVMLLPADKIALLLRGYFDGDGHYGEKRISAACASFDLTMQVERLVRRLGIVTTINKSSSTTNLGTECVWWTIGPCTADNNAFAQKLGIDPTWHERERAFAEWDESGEGYWVKAFRVEHGEYTGPVYNFEVEEDHSYVGSVATHNCIGEAFPLGSFDEGLGVWEHEELINPEDIRIENFPLLASKQLKVIPPEYLKRLVSTKSPQKEYKQLEIEYPDLIPYLRRGEPFPVSDVLLKQVAFTANPWDDHGTPILLRGLRTLMHQEKLLASQDAIAERLYSPLILAKLGTQDLGDGAGPWIPSQENLSQFRDDMDIALASDFRLIVHHFALEIENVFGREQVPDLNNDFDRIERQLMQVFGVNPSLLSAGSNSQPYASSALQAEFMNQMLKTYQNYLKQHYRDRALVVAEAQEHFDFEKRGDTRIPIYEEVLVRDEETGVERIEKRRKLLIPDLEMSVLDMRDEATERAFLMQLRSMGVPISDGNLMVGVNFKYKDSLDEMKQEMIQKTVAQQEAKLEAYQILETRGLPIPPDLAAEVAAGTTGGGSGGGMDIGGPGGSGAGPGPGGPGPGGPPGSPIVMPDAPEGVPGGGPPVTGPIEGGPPGPVPEISNERRKGLQYNTKTRHEVKASNGETESIIERLPKAKKVLSFPIVYEDFEDKEEILDLGRRSETTASRLQDGPAASPGVPGP